MNEVSVVDLTHPPVITADYIFGCFGGLKSNRNLRSYGESPAVNGGRRPAESE